MSWVFSVSLKLISFSIKIFANHVLLPCVPRKKKSPKAILFINPLQPNRTAGITF